MFGENLTLDGVKVTGNVSATEGGAIAVASMNSGGAGFLAIRNSTISGNTANGVPVTYGGAGGGIYFQNQGSLLVENSTISGNTSTNSVGGGIYFYGTIGANGFNIRNSTISGNTSALSGGGVYLATATGTSFIDSSTIAFNTATTGAGGGLSTDGVGNTISLNNSVVAFNTNSTAPDAVGPITESFSLIRDPSNATITDGGGNLVSTAGSPLNPLFAAAGLADNGGPTQTISLQAGSPLMNVGSTTLTTDQRGVTRPIGAAPDIGAVEIQTAAPTVSTAVINGGAAQRSRVTSIDVSFNTIVTLGAGAFTLTRVGLPNMMPGDNATVTIGVTTQSVGGHTVATLTFSGVNTTSGSLNDGNWTLTVDHTKVAAKGTAMAADFTQTNIKRLFGDINGDGFVNTPDLVAFRSAIGTMVGDPSYSAAFDINGDGFINTPDLVAFRTNIGSNV